MDFSKLKEYLGMQEEPVPSLSKQDIDRPLYAEQAEEKRLKRNEDINAMMESLAQIESSGGKNFKHKRIEDPNSVQYGDEAIGTYGLMPNTVKEIAGSDQSPEIRALLKLKSDQIKAALEGNPELEQQVARRLGEKVYDRQGGDIEKAAYAWNQGHNLPPERITKDKLQKSQYIQKLRALKKPELLQC